MNKSTLYIVPLIALLMNTTSCNSGSQSVSPIFSISASENTIEISTEATNTDYSLSIRRVSDYNSTKVSSANGITIKEDPDIKSARFRQSCSIDVMDLLKQDSRPYDIALQLIENGNVKYKVRILDKFDTTLIIKPKIDVNIAPDFYANVKKGLCAKLNSKESNKQNIINTKKWLYDNNLHKSDSVVLQITNIVSQLNQSAFNEFETDDKIPVVKSLANLYYNIGTNLKADYYYLFATDNENELHDFIKEVCVTDFENGEKNINNSLSCFRLKDKSGILCIFLIGVNKDWSKNILPLGLIALDNSAPIVNSSSQTALTLEELLGTKSSESKYIIEDFSINLPPNCPATTGRVNISTNDFRGNHANFEINFSGDIKSVSIKREIHRSYMWLKPETKTIVLEDKKSPYRFTYELDLGIGDNYIPITVLDKCGNKTEYSLNIPMVAVEDKNPSINIDNNIDIWN